MRLLAALFASLIVTGCATVPPPEVLATADYGEYPQEYQRIIKDYASRSLKDPGSAQYEFTNYPKQGYYGIGGPKYGYVVCVNINAKNGFGGYVGSRQNYFMIRNGAVIDATLSTSGDYGDTIARAKCKPYPVERVT